MFYLKLSLKNMANEEAQETVNQNINKGKNRKISRHWDEDETRKLISK